MNREIKYRYWINGKPYIFNMRDIESAMASSEIMSGKYTDRDEYIGSNDKRGMEIYTGDIIKNFYYNSKNLVVVKYLEKSGRDILYNGFEVPSKDCEIVGNIYENKELLQ